MRKKAEQVRDLDESGQSAARRGTPGGVTRHLTLDRQIIRVLTDNELSDVAGGLVSNTFGSLHSITSK
jgi:hypothetical protein